MPAKYILRQTEIGTLVQVDELNEDQINEHFGNYAEPERKPDPSSTQNCGKSPLLPQVSMILCNGRAKRLSPFNRGQVREEVAKLEEMGLVTKSSSPWSSPIVVVWQPGKTKIWLFVDFREINKCIVDDWYPLL